MATIYVHKINIIPKEEIAVKMLKSVFEEELSQYDGKIWIIPSIDIHVGTGRHDIDVLIIGHLETPYLIDDVSDYHNIEIKSFITTVELKSHNVEGIQQDGTHLKVKYPGDYEEDVTVQSREQKFSLRKFLEENLQYEDIRVPFITNVILLTGASYEDLEHSGIFIENVLASDFVMEEFFEAIARQTKLQNNGFVDSFKNHTEAQISSIVNVFCAKSDGADTMTLRRINILQQDQGVLNNLETTTDPIIVLSGHAGTGKTMMMLKAADMISKKGHKCLFLTYNTALISDINHSIQYMPENQLANVDRKSMYSFFSSILFRLNIINNKSEIVDRFDALMSQLNKRLRNNPRTIDYEYIFVDEAQDWKKNEVESLKQLCLGKHIVIADGIDQFMRSELHSNWGKPSLPKLKKSLRQRCNLTTFAQVFACKLGVYWDVEANSKLQGGRVIITEGYEKDIHEELLDSVKKHGCTAYDLMLLAPPSLSKEGQFALTSTYENLGIPFYDGINKENRDKVYGSENAKREECRIYQYESCRGLESWVTVCLRFHELFSSPHPHDYKDIQYEAARKYMLALWTLIPLTRAVDTLVLVVKHDSKIAHILKDISDELDFVEYRNNKHA